MNIKRRGKIQTLERVVGQVGQDIKAMAEYFDGQLGGQAQAIYTNNIMLAAVIKHLGIDADVKAIVLELEAEAKARHEAAKEAQAAKQAELAVAKAVDTANANIKAQNDAAAKANTDLIEAIMKNGLPPETSA